MARTFANYLAPVGDVHPDHFPGEDTATLQGRIAGYITEAAGLVGDLTTDAEKDAATDCWVYYKAWGALYARIVGQANSNAIADEGSASITVQQIRDVKAMRDAARACFDAKITSATPAANSRIPYGPSTTRITP